VAEPAWVIVYPDGSTEASPREALADVYADVAGGCWHVVAVSGVAVVVGFGADAAPVTYLSASQFAQRIGVALGTLSRYNLPEPDALIGTTRGWTEGTIDAWHAARPGRGNWGSRSAVVAARQRDEVTS